MTVFHLGLRNRSETRRRVISEDGEVEERNEVCNSL